MELALLKFINGPSFGEVATDGGGVFDVLSTHKVECVMVDSPALCRRLPAGSARVVEANDDNEVNDAIIAHVTTPRPLNQVAVFRHLHDYRKVPPA